MSRWFRFYDDVINDPKVLCLPEAMRWAWVAVLCIASKNDGKLPSIDHVALMLRLPKARAAATLAGLHNAGLLDKTETGFEPHNWAGRQYKSDVSTERVKRFRNGQRNAKRNVSETPPDTDNRKQISEAKASDAGASIDPSIAEREFFARGREVLGKSAGGQLAKLKASKGHNIALARAAIETAATKENPAEYVAALIRGPPPVRASTVHQQRQAEGRAVLDELHEFNTRESRRTDSELLRHNPGDEPESLRGRAGGNLVELSASGDRSGG